jgi:hypothetical protein
MKITYFNRNLAAIEESVSDGSTSQEKLGQMFECAVDEMRELQAAADLVAKQVDFLNELLIRNGQGELNN